MTADLAQRLREEAALWEDTNYSGAIDLTPLLREAAAAIDSLTAERDRMEAALDVILNATLGATREDEDS